MSAPAVAAADARGISGSPGTWRRVRRAAQEASAHALLLCFTTLLSLKLDGVFSRSWWVVFIPLWLFHAVVAQYRLSLPALLSPQSCQVMVNLFLDLKLLFLPLLGLKIITLVDNFRMCGALMPGYGETITDEDIWESLPYFWDAISMVFLLAATSLMLLKLYSNLCKYY